MDNFKILVISWSIVWACALGVLGDVRIYAQNNAAALIEVLVGHTSQAWTVFPAFCFFVWAAGVILIAIGLHIFNFLKKLNKKFGWSDNENLNPIIEVNPRKKTKDPLFPGK